MKILVAHRQKQTVEAIRSVLSSVNPVIRYTDSGLDGLLTSRIESFDMIICGTDLPVVTGFEMVRSIRTSSVNRRTTVIFLSADPDAKTLYLGHALRAAAVLNEKDFSTQVESIVVGQLISHGRPKLRLSTTPAAVN